ncbi:MAG: sulfatase-like hydrolase/transferase, partial [Acidobacteriota bacterium]
MPRTVSLVLLVSVAGGTLSCHESPPATPVSVLLVTIDTLRADRLGMYGRGEAATPNLDRLADEGTVFLDAVAHSPLTLPSHSSILTGTYPTYHGVRDNGRFRLPEQIDTLAEILKRAGYSTGAFVGGFPVHSRFGLSQGFDRYDDRLTRSPATLAFTERRAEEVVLAAREWRKGQEQGLYFLWVHLFDPHAPYDPPEPFRSQHPDRYAGEVAYVDHALGSLFSAIGEGALTIVTADHGEGLGEHGESTHSLFLYDSTLRVPLIFRGPGSPRGAVVSEQVRTIDILPTLLELVGQAEACDACQGESLARLMRGEDREARTSYAETFFPRLNLGWSELRSVRRKGWKYIAAPKPELYDLAADPAELQNLASKKPRKLQELAAELSALETSTQGSLAASSRSLPDRATLSLLRSLGYLSAGRPPPAEGPLPDPKSRLAVWQKLRQGMDLVARGEFDEGIVVFEALLQHEAGLLLAQSYLSGAYFEGGRYEAAARQCAEILAADPADFDAALLLGRSLLRLGRPREAKQALEQAARLDHQAADPLAELANLHFQQGARRQAREALA